MRILLLAHYYPPEMGGAAARLHGLARWLTHFGHNVTVIAGFPNYPSGSVPSWYRGKLKADERLDGVHVRRVWIYASSHRSGVRRLANYLSFVASAAIAGLLARERYDVVVASSPPLFIGLAALAIARLRRIPFVFDIRDIWPEVAIEVGEFPPDGLITKLTRRLASFLYRRADHITPVTENKRRKLLVAGVPAGRLSVVSNGVDLDLVPDAVDRGKRSELGLDGEFVVLYAGLIGIAQGVDIVAAAADLLRAQQNIRFLIVGDGVRRAELAQRVSQFGLSNVMLLGRQPREAMPGLLAAADVCWVPLANENLQDAVPSKLLEAWAHRKPVILGAAGEAAALVSACGGGVIVPPGDPSSLAQAALALSGDSQRCAACAERGNEYVRNHLDRRLLARQMEQVLVKAIAASSRPEQRRS